VPYGLGRRPPPRRAHPSCANPVALPPEVSAYVLQECAPSPRSFSDRPSAKAVVTGPCVFSTMASARPPRTRGTSPAWTSSASSTSPPRLPSLWLRRDVGGQDRRVRPRWRHLRCFAARHKQRRVRGVDRGHTFLGGEDYDSAWSTGWFRVLPKSTRSTCAATPWLCSGSRTRPKRPSANSRRCAERDHLPFIISTGKTKPTTCIGWSRRQAGGAGPWI